MIYQQSLLFQNNLCIGACDKISLTFLAYSSVKILGIPVELYPQYHWKHQFSIYQQLFYYSNNNLCFRAGAKNLASLHLALLAHAPVEILVIPVGLYPQYY